MTGRFSLAAGAALLIAGGVPAAASSSACAPLDNLYLEARGDFPALKQRSFPGAKCSYGKRQFKCDWSFPADTFAAAEAQAARLEQCTAAQPRVEPLPGGRDEAAFQINPETSVLIRGPMLDSGSWKLRLQITTTADWD